MARGRRGLAGQPRPQARRRFAISSPQIAMPIAAPRFEPVMKIALASTRLRARNSSGMTPNAIGTRRRLAEAEQHRRHQQLRKVARQSARQRRGAPDQHAHDQHLATTEAVGEPRQRDGRDADHERDADALQQAELDVAQGQREPQRLGQQREHLTIDVGQQRHAEQDGERVPRRDRGVACRRVRERRRAVVRGRRGRSRDGDRLRRRHGQVRFDRGDVQGRVGRAVSTRPTT